MRLAGWLQRYLRGFRETVRGPGGYVSDPLSRPDMDVSHALFGLIPRMKSPPWLTPMTPLTEVA